MKPLHGPSEPSDAETTDELLLLLARARRCDRLVALTQLTSHLAHQLGSPLNVVEGRAAMIASGQIADGDVQRNARIIAEQSSRMVNVLKSAVTFLRELGEKPSRVDLAGVLRTAASASESTARAKGVVIALDAERRGATLAGNPDALLVLLLHLVENALHATLKGGTVTLRLRAVSIAGTDDLDGPPKPFWRLEVEDQGPGVDPAVSKQLFQPFTTVRDARGGIGMGLFEAQAIAKEHGGFIRSENNGSTGARFTLHLPRGQENAEQDSIRG